MRDIRSKIEAMLAERGIRLTLAPRQPLFTSGLLDSMAAVEVMMMLEAEFGIDFADADFDLARLDTIADLEALAAQSLAA